MLGVTVPRGRGRRGVAGRLVKGGLRGLPHQRGRSPPEGEPRQRQARGESGRDGDDGGGEASGGGHDGRKDFSYRGGQARESWGPGRSSRRAEDAVVVHGGGACRDIRSRERYGLSSRRVSPSSEGVSETRRAMFDLNGRICAAPMIAGGLRAYTFSPFPLLTAAGAEGAVCARADRLGWPDPAHLRPTSSREGSGFRILSGDTIAPSSSRGRSGPRGASS